jgi:hypothetical protein
MTDDERMGGARTWQYSVRPADPGHRSDSADSHEVVLYLDGRPQRVVGVWQMKHQAMAVRSTLNRWAEGQIR